MVGADPARRSAAVNVTDFFDYLLGRDATHDLAVQLVSVYQVRSPRWRMRRVEPRV
jgi:hypothetical protein